MTAPINARRTIAVQNGYLLVSLLALIAGQASANQLPFELVAVNGGLATGTAGLHYAQPIVTGLSDAGTVHYRTGIRELEFEQLGGAWSWNQESGANLVYGSKTTIQSELNSSVYDSIVVFGQSFSNHDYGQTVAQWGWVGKEPAIFGNSDDYTFAIWITEPGAPPRIVAEYDQPAPGLPGYLIRPGDFYPVVFDRQGGVSFLALAYDSSRKAEVHSLWRETSTGELELVSIDAVPAPGLPSKATLGVWNITGYSADNVAVMQGYPKSDASDPLTTNSVWLLDEESRTTELVSPNQILPGSPSGSIGGYGSMHYPVISERGAVAFTAEVQLAAGDTSSRSQKLTSLWSEWHCRSPRSAQSELGAGLVVFVS